MSKIKGPDIVWEDEDDKSGGGQDATRAEFEEMLVGDAVDVPTYRSGDKVRGTVTSVNQETREIFVDLGLKTVGILTGATLEADGGSDTLPHVGNTIEAFVISTRGDEVILGRTLSKRLQDDEALHTARANGIPVRGRVTGENKGGFDVSLMGRSAFCPVSQIDSRFVEVKSEYIGKEFDFLVEKIAGKTIVVSRAALLRRQAATKLEEIAATRQSDPERIYDGVVREVRPFGAFVDIGGTDGLVHVSEMSYSRVENAGEILQPGQKVRVKVLAISESEGKKRLSLSMKAADKDPWDSALERLDTGATYEGRVTRVMNFGAFVEILPGIEGLVHVSEMSWVKRIRHPSEVVEIGQIVNVSPKTIDPSKRQIALTMKSLEQDPWREAANKFRAGTRHEARVSALKSFGAICELVPGVEGLLPLGVIKTVFGEGYRKKCSPPQSIAVVIGQIDADARRVSLTLEGASSEDQEVADFREYEAARAAEESAQAAAAPPSTGINNPAPTPAAAAGSNRGGGGLRGSFGDVLAASMAKSQGQDKTGKP